MSGKSKFKLIPLLLSATGVLLVGGVIFYLSSPVNNAEAGITLQHKDSAVVELGKAVYAKNCASCHGIQLEGKKNWRRRNSEGYLPAPPHDETGHTWHHSDSYLFNMTKYGIEKIIGKKYQNNMPAYDGILSDDEIIAVLSYIKSMWPKSIREKHDQINARASSFNKRS